MRHDLGLKGALGLLTLAGCPPDDVVIITASDTDTSTSTSGEPTTEDGPPTSSTGEPDPTTTGGPEFDGVIAPTLRIYRPLDGAEIEASRDPLLDHENLTIVASGVTYPAVYAEAERRLEFADVPKAMYSLRAQQPAAPDLPDLPGRLSVTQSVARELESFGGICSGRPDIAFTGDLETTLAISAGEMLPLGPEDQFEFYSYNADALFLVFPNLDEMDATGSPQLDETEIVDWTIPWRPDSGRDAWPLVDTAEGDDFWLGHLVATPLVPAPMGAELQDPWSFAQRYVLGETAKLSLPTMTSGATTAVSGTFKAVAGETVSVDLRASEFMAELQIYDAALKSVGCFVAAVLEPGAEHPITGVAPNLGGINVYGIDAPIDPECVGMDCETMFVTPGDRVLELELGNPYSEDGTETLIVQCSRYVFVDDPDGGAYDYLASDLIVQGRLEDLTQAPIVPKIGLVRDLAVNGTPVAPDEKLDGVGENPTISFTAPKFGAPDFYTVTIRTLDDVMGADGPVVRRAIGSIRTEFTTVTIPDGFLEPGGHYYIQVTAERSHGLTEAHAKSHDIWLSRAMTGVLTP
ncbi:hypothetical protein [Nannocystis sp. SCPEA4]|uniref:hypothetical protein n=1 Tax=Nannocystis sp. SCPEA4 TaxID=2996787 RepID=UPI00226E18A9|nr:hypothetical protein [Nannocystis sp. SCPEA4]MCY1055362.1 hypothetical protein [Nannocystis sp. SCPEA4]